MAELDKELEVRLTANTEDIALVFGRLANELEFIAKAFRESAGRLYAPPTPAEGPVPQTSPEGGSNVP